MYINEMPRKLKILALVRKAEDFIRNQNKARFIELGHSVDCFVWDQTPEGAEFWADIHYGDIIVPPKPPGVIRKQLEEIDIDEVIAPFAKAKHPI